DVDAVVAGAAVNAHAHRGGAKDPGAGDLAAEERRAHGAHEDVAAGFGARNVNTIAAGVLDVDGKEPVVLRAVFHEHSGSAAVGHDGAGDEVEPAAGAEVDPDAGEILERAAPELGAFNADQIE